jgi:ATP-dependent DNA helicase RecG
MIHPLDMLTGVGPKRQKVLREAGIRSLEDLVRWVPREWLDRTRLKSIAELREGDTALIRGRVASARLFPGGRERLSVQLQDDSGKIELLFFHYARNWEQRLTPGSEWIASGKVSGYRGPQIVHPELTEVDPTEPWQGEIQPVYPLTEAMREARMEQRFLRKAIQQALGVSSLRLTEPFPEALRNELGFLPELDHLRRLHQPTSQAEIESGFRQLKYAEILPVTIRMARRRELMLTRGRALLGGDALQGQLEAKLPFTLTAGQRAAVAAISAGLAAPRQFQCLLQGDVGSGKTAVAALVAVAAVGAGVQAAFLAPTEILAWQHWRKLDPLFAELGIRSGLLTGSTPPPARRELLTALADGSLQLLFGTHALFSADVTYAHLGFVVIDEQHRFGVGQRAALMAKGRDPDLLAMSATPIPRSLVMTLYGDLQPISLAEKPAGRQPIQTRMVPAAKRDGLKHWIAERIGAGERVYWVVPRVEEDESSELQSVEALAEELRASFGAKFSVGVVHGRLPDDQKQRALERFATGQDHLLAATTVIEVGVDVPEAGVIVIEGAERFGLAQLHQLRGRVGRGGQEAWCFLLAEASAEERLRAFAATEDGFAIAELDLDQRGAGNLEGLQQSGESAFRWFDFVRDRELIQQSADFARAKIRAWETLDPAERDLYQRWCAADALENHGAN